VCIVVVPLGLVESEIPAALKAMTQIHRLLVDAGGKRYLAGWLPETDEAFWRSHFGARYDIWLEARRTYDPAGTFTSVLSI
jgi:cytokinin dehydrogenase